MDRIRKIKESFNKHSERYENWFSKEKGKIISETEKNAVEKLIPKGKGLEVGVGSGIFASKLGTEYGMDPAENLLEIARSRGVKTVLGIAEKLPFKKESFDYLLIMFTLSFLSDPLNAFKEARRVLKDSGKLIVCYIQKKSPWGELYRKKKAENHDFYSQAKFYNSGELEKLLEKSEFRKNRTISTLLQRPDSIENVEEPVEGIDRSAGLCCFEATKL